MDCYEFYKQSHRETFLTVYTSWYQDVNTEEIKVGKKETCQDGTNSYKKYMALWHDPAVRK